MKESTKLILTFAGAGVLSNLLLASSVAGATSGYPMATAGAEGLAALGGGYMAWKGKGKTRMIAAAVGGVGAGLLAASVQSGALSPAPAPKPAGGASSQSTSVTKPAGAALPTPSVGQGPGTVPLLPQQTTTLPGFSSASGQIPPGAAVPAPNRPPTAAEVQAYADYEAQELQNQQVAMAQQQAYLQQGGLPTVQPDTTTGGDYFPSDQSDQSGAVVRLGMAKPAKRGGFGGAGASFRRMY